MNKEHIKATLEALKATKTFEMGSYSENLFVPKGEENPAFSTPTNDYVVRDDGSHYCKTAACIAGHAAFLADPEVFQNTRAEGLHWIAEKWLDLTQSDARDLFLVEGDTVPDGATLSTITQAEAITALEKLLETGEVDWSHADTYPDDYYGDDD